MASIALLSPIRLGLHEAPTAAERSALAEHVRFLQRLVAEGRVLTAGPCEDGSLGLVVFPNADAATASALMATDPAVVAGVFRVEVKAWRRSLLGHGSGRDWTGFTQAVHIQASPSEAWSMFATPSG
ncbi:MAG: YciI family protein, partial [Phycisphaerales bacterium]